MDWVLTGAVVFAAWNALRLLGNERQRRVEAMSAPAPPAADTAADSPSVLAPGTAGGGLG